MLLPAQAVSQHAQELTHSMESILQIDLLYIVLRSFEPNQGILEPFSGMEAEIPCADPRFPWVGSVSPVLRGQLHQRLSFDRWPAYVGFVSGQMRT